MDLLWNLPVDVLYYCLFVSLEYSDLLYIRCLNKGLKKDTDKYIEKIMRKKSGLPNLEIKDAVWVITEIARSPYPMVTKSIAKERYRLTDKQLASMNCKYSTRSSRGKYALLYDLENVLFNCLKRHSSYDNLVNYKLKLTERRVKMHENKELRKTKRREELEEELSKLKLQIRSDSKLAYRYIEGSIPMGLKYVVNRLAQIHYLFTYCDIQTKIDEIKRRQLQEYLDIMSDYAHEMFHAVWDGVDYVDMAEQELGIIYPEKWPWLTS